MHRYSGDSKILAVCYTQGTDLRVMWRIRIVRDRLEITGACLSDGSVFSIWALCFKAEWKSITTPVLVELLSVDSVLNIRCSEEGMSQEIRSATSKRNPKLSHRFLLRLNHSVSVFWLLFFFCSPFHSSSFHFFLPRRSLQNPLWLRSTVSW